MTQTSTSQKAVANWLLFGVFMLIIQILLGGITRLTGSGLSITEWEVVTGTLPPLNETKWLEEFAKYKGTPQYQLLNTDFTLSDFKFIFFWEWFHRLWARFMGLVFLFGFIYYVLSNKSSNLKMTLHQHLLMILMTFSFSISSIIHWKNLFKSIPPLVIISNQEIVVFITTVIGLLLTDNTQLKFSFYKKHFFKVVVMAFVVFLALLFSFLGLKQTNPIVSSLLFLASPLTTIVMNMLYFKEYISKHNILALFLMCVGAFILHFLSSI